MSLSCCSVWHGAGEAIVKAVHSVKFVVEVVILLYYTFSEYRYSRGMTAKT